jgi:DNA ligase-1
VIRITGPSEFMQCKSGLNLDTEDLTHYVMTGEYWMEEKLDGIRAWVWKGKDGVKIWTRKHIDVTNKFPGIVEAVSYNHPNGPWWFDGEITSTYGHNDVQAVLAGKIDHSGINFRPFDLLATPNYNNLYAHTFRQRRIELEHFAPDRTERNNMFKPVIQKVIIEEMLEFYQQLFDAKSEGVVLKRWNDSYDPSIGGSWIKSKFTDTVSVVPLSIDDETLMVQCGMISGPDTFLTVGHVKVDFEDMLMLINTMGNSSDIKPVLELTIYGAGDNLKLRHPVYKGLRFEAGYDSCSHTQLAHLRRY